MENLENIIESLLFVSEDPVTIEALKEILEEADTKEIREALASLSDGYEARGGGFYLSEVAGGYQLRSRPRYAEWIRRLVQPNAPRLSKAALETLAIIAYKQPVIRTDVEHIRGVDSGGVMRMLLERKLIRILGRKEIPGRPLIYATTKLFLQVFDLKNLKDLPTPKEIETMSAEARLAEMPGDIETGEASDDPGMGETPDSPGMDEYPDGPEISEAPDIPEADGSLNGPDAGSPEEDGDAPHGDKDAPSAGGNAGGAFQPDATETQPADSPETKTGGQEDEKAVAQPADEEKNT
ncbi:MAG: SMC-Scp complex subunit ScpB [Desulfobacterales bacterium]|nr:SMC-Scp complex subunit ScpB [Desulfobacterales bacterium]